MAGMPKLDPVSPPNLVDDKPTPGTPLLTPATPGEESEVFAPPFIMPGPGPIPNAELDVDVFWSLGKPPPEPNPPPNPGDGDPPNFVGCIFIASLSPSSSDIVGLLFFVVPPPASNPGGD